MERETKKVGKEEEREIGKMARGIRMVVRLCH